MSPLAEARANLAAALEPVLPGRVQPYPRHQTRWVAPSIWIEQATQGRQKPAGQRSFVASTVLPVVVAMDGADHAQVAGHDDLVSAVWDAALTVPHCRPTGFQSTTINVGGDVTLRGTVVEVELTFTAVTMCQPTVTAVPIPPEPITQESP